MEGQRCRKDVSVCAVTRPVAVGGLDSPIHGLPPKAGERWNLANRAGVTGHQPQGAGLVFQKSVSASLNCLCGKLIRPVQFKFTDRYGHLSRHMLHARLKYL